MFFQQQVYSNDVNSIPLSVVKDGMQVLDLSHFDVANVPPGSIVNMGDLPAELIKALDASQLEGIRLFISSSDLLNGTLLDILVKKGMKSLTLENDIFWCQSSTATDTGFFSVSAETIQQIPKLENRISDLEKALHNRDQTSEVVEQPNGSSINSSIRNIALICYQRFEHLIPTFTKPILMTIWRGLSK